MAHSDNYFLILGLGEYKLDASFVDMSIIGASDDDVSVMQKIKSAIEKKQPEWSNPIDPRNNARYSHYRYLIPKMESELKSLDTRKQLYADAKVQIAEMLKRPLDQYQKRGFAYNEELERLAKRCELTVDTVKAFVTVPVKTKKAAGETLKKPQAAQKYKDNDLRMSTYGFTDIYAFLCEGSQFTRKSLESADDWLTRAKGKKDSLPEVNSPEVGDKTKICNFCIEDVFSSEEKKKDYDDYLSWKQMNDVLQEALQTAAVTKSLSKEQGRDFIDDLQSAGVDKNKAIAYLRGFCNEKGIAWESEGAGTLSSLVQCPYCPGMVESKAKLCPHCGGEIITICPKCKTGHSVRDRFCSSCNYDFNNFKRAVALCEKAKIEIDVLNMQLAKLILDEAEELCSSVKEIAELRSEWKRKDDRYGAIAKKIEDNAKRKFFVTAKRDYDALKSQFPQYSNPKLEETISAALAIAKKALTFAEQENDQMLSCRHALTAYQSCRDFPGISKVLSKFQPSPVDAISVKSNSIKRSNIITWSSRKNEFTTFLVIRKEGTNPISVEDGDVCREVASDSFSDTEIEANVGYCYAVAACVGPITSPLVHFPSVVTNLFEVQQLTVQSSKSTVLAQWLGVPGNAGVEVWRDVSANPAKPGIGTKVNNMTSTEMVDHDLENDKTYYYRIFVKYVKGAKTVFSNGISFTGLPAAPPQIVDYVLIAHKKDKTFDIEWDADENESVSFFLASEPVFKQGQSIDISSLGNSAIHANIIYKSNNAGEFQLPDSKLYYIFPVTQKNNTAVIGAIMPVTAQKPFSIDKVQISGNDVFIKLNKWPDEIKRVLLLYRNDRYPISPSDATARKIPVKKELYNQRQAIPLNNLSKGTYYFSLFGEMNVSGTSTYSVPDFYTFKHGTSSRIVYEIKPQSTFGKLKSVNINITPPEDGTVPELIVVANSPSLPVFRSQGSVVYEISSQKQKSPFAVNIPVPKDGFPKMTFLKVFTKNEHDAGSYEVSLSMSSNPCIR